MFFEIPSSTLLSVESIKSAKLTSVGKLPLLKKFFKVRRFIKAIVNENFIQNQWENDLKNKKFIESPYNKHKKYDNNQDLNDGFSKINRIENKKESLKQNSQRVKSI